MKILKEILWIIISLVLSLLVQYPILRVIEYKFFAANTLVIFISIYYLRMAADMKNMFFVKNKWFRYLFFSFNLFLFVFIITRVQKLVILFDVFSITAFAENVVILSPLKESNIMNYINNEFLFFGVFSLVAITVLNVKILVSFWKKY